MTTYKRAVALFAVLLAAVISLIALATSGSAAPYTPSIAVNSPVCTSGTVTGTGFAPNESVTLTSNPHGETVGTATTSPTGTFTATVTFPSSVKGSRLLVATGSTGDSASKRILVNTQCGVAGQSSSRASSSGVAGESASRTGGTGGLSATGVAVWTIGGLGVLLLIAGALFTFGGRRGRRA